MKKLASLLFILTSLCAAAQNTTSDTTPAYQSFDTVTISAIGRSAVKNIPYSIQNVSLRALQRTPRPQLMQQLALLPSVSIINSGNGINKPVIRGLSFNHIQLFAMGARIDNQTWDDRHDIGISEAGFDKVEIINGPSALLYGPNAMGGAILFHENTPGIRERANGYAQLTFFGNSVGGNFSAGVREGRERFFYSLAASAQMHANYEEGKKDEEEEPGAPEEDKPLAPNSKFSNFAFKGMLGTRSDKGEHRFSYSIYQQLLGIIEDEEEEPGGEEERDYEMEAPYQDVQTHILSTENIFHLSNSDLQVNASYQFNRRKEFEPGEEPKSKELGVGLNLQTITGDIQWQKGKSKPAGVTVGVQASYQNNKNKGMEVLVPDAHITTAGAFIVGHLNVGRWNLLGGVRLDFHKLQMFETESEEEDTLVVPFPEPEQELDRDFTPFSFSAGAVYHPNTNLSFKLNLASGYTAPNYAQLTSFGKHEGTFRFEVGDDELTMEQNIEADFSVLWENKEVTFSVNPFYNHIKNYIFITPTADSVGGLKIYEWTQHDANLYGVEFGLRVHPSSANWFEGSIDAGFLRGKLTNSMGDLPYIPAGKVITELTFKKESATWQRGYITGRLSVYGKQEKVAEFEEDTEGYALADIYLGVAPPLGKNHRWDLSVFCTNIFNKGYFNHLSLVKAIDVREPGRNIGAQLRFSF